MIYFLIPIYNEEHNIPSLFAELKNALANEERMFVFSDDGSTDNSKAVIAQYFREERHIVLGDGSNHGPGNAFRVGFEWILQHSPDGNDIVATLEADCTSDITLLPKMIAMNRLGYNLVLASVYAQGGGFEKTSFFRKLLSSGANLFFRFVFDIKVLTLSSFYRVYSVDLLRRIQQNNTSIIHEKGFICMLEVLIKAIREHASIIEVPMVLHSSKRVGKSKMKILKTCKDYLRFMLKRHK